jgi:hypothetical protein
VTIPLAMLATRAVRSQLFDVSLADPVVYGVGILMICVVAALAGVYSGATRRDHRSGAASRTD